jgi:hypothetical protein
LRSFEDFIQGAAAAQDSFGAVLVGDLLSTDVNGDVTLAPGAQLVDVGVADLPSSTPQNYEITGPLIRFGVTNVEGEELNDVAPEVPGFQVRVIIDLPAGSLANTYLKYNELTGQWAEFLDDQRLETYDDGATLLDTDGDFLIDRIVLTLTDGGSGDQDGVINGFIQDPGALAYSQPLNPVYVVKLENGDLYYTSDAADAGLMSIGLKNQFLGAQFDNMIEQNQSIQFQAFQNFITKDWYFAETAQDMPYACYLQQQRPGFLVNSPGSEGGVDFYLYLDSSGETVLASQDQASMLGLDSGRYVNLGAIFNATVESAFSFDPEGYLIANQRNVDIQQLVLELASRYQSTSDAGFIEAVEQHYLDQVQVVGLPNGSDGNASALQLNAVFGTSFEM